MKSKIDSLALRGVSFCRLITKGVCHMMRQMRERGVDKTVRMRQMEEGGLTID